jgi:hypothetical protein
MADQYSVRRGPDVHSDAIPPAVTVPRTADRLRISQATMTLSTLDGARQGSPATSAASALVGGCSSTGSSPTSPRRTPRSMRSDMADWSCIVARVMSVVRRTIAAWLDARPRYGDIAQQAAQQPALCTAEGTRPTGRTRRGPLTHRSTSRRAVGAARAAGAGPSAAERGRAGRRAARL